MQPGQRLPPGQQAADPGRVAEHLVPAHGHELRLDHREVEPVRRDERRRVEQHVIAGRLGQVHPGQRVLDAAEVALRRVAEQAPPAAAAGTFGAPERRGDLGLGDPQIRRRHGGISDRGATRAGELPDAVHRVVVIGGEHQVRPGPERVRLADQAACARRVLGEDDRVLLRGSVEVTEHGLPGLLDQQRGRGRGRALGVRVAEAPAAHSLHVGAQLGIGGQPGTGVIQVDVAAGVEVGVLASAQLVQASRGGVVRVGGEKIGHCSPHCEAERAGTPPTPWPG